MTDLRALTCSCSVPLFMCVPAFGQTLLYEFEGAPGDALGQGISSAGDVDLDGHADFILGAPGAAQGAGMAYVRSGADGSVFYTYTGSTADAGLGSRAAEIGDTDGDTYPDFAISAFRDSTNGTKAGAVFLFSGQDGSLLHTFPGEQDWEFGLSLAGAGDVDADGVPDLLAGSRTGPTGSGMVRVYSGQSGSVLHEILGDTFQDAFGTDLDGVGDLDGDGHDDFIVSAPQANLTGDRLGWVRAYSGADASILFEIDGEEPVGLFGESVSGLGDVNGDGVPDFLAAAAREDTMFNDAGVVRVFSGADAAMLYAVEGRSSAELFGLGLSGGKDVNGDDVPDWLAGGPAFNGLGVGAGRAVDGPSGVVLCEFDGLAAGDSFGEQVALLGDVSGHGVSAIAITAWNHSSASGLVQIHEIDCTSGETPYCIANPNSTGLAAEIHTTGSNSIAANDFHLTVEHGVPNRVGLFIYSADRTQVPFGDGYLCLRPGGTGIVRLNPVVKFDGAGFVSRRLDFESPPASSGKGQIVAGGVWNFQMWYRDPGGPGGSGFNLTAGVSRIFCP